MLDLYQDGAGRIVARTDAIAATLTPCPGGAIVHSPLMFGDEPLGSGPWHVACDPADGAAFADALIDLYLELRAEKTAMIAGARAHARTPATAPRSPRRELSP